MALQLRKSSTTLHTICGNKCCHFCHKGYSILVCLFSPFVSFVYVHSLHFFSFHYFSFHNGKTIRNKSKWLECRYSSVVVLLHAIKLIACLFLTEKKISNPFRTHSRVYFTWKTMRSGCPIFYGWLLVLFFTFSL